MHSGQVQYHIVLSVYDILVTAPVSLDGSAANKRNIMHSTEIEHPFLPVRNSNGTITLSRLPDEFVSIHTSTWVCGISPGEVSATLHARFGVWIVIYKFGELPDFAPQTSFRELLIKEINPYGVCCAVVKALCHCEQNKQMITKYIYIC